MYLTLFSPQEANKVLNGRRGIIEQIDYENILPYTIDPFTLVNGIVEDEAGDIVAVGLLRVVNEFKLIINPAKSKFKIASAIDRLLQEGFTKCKTIGANELLIVVTQGEERYEHFLSKNYGFEKVNGTLMKLEGV